MTLRRAKQLRQIAIPLLVGGAALTAFDLARRVFRHTQLFCPSPDPTRSWNPADYGIPPEVVEEHWFETPDGEMLYGWYCRAANPIASGVFCHGNTGNLTTSADVIPHLLAAGINVLFFDYRGFGRSGGIPSINGVVSDGVTAGRFHDSIRPKSLPSILYGYSLGGAVAAQVIRRHHFDALILQSTFTSLPHITRVLFPRIPLHIFAGKLFDTIGVVRNLTVPLLVLHGSADEVVPQSMARELIEACPAPKNLHLIEGGLHKDIYLRDRDSLVWAINRFLSGLEARTGEPPVRNEEAGHPLIDRSLRTLRRLLRFATQRVSSPVIASAAVSNASRR